MEKTDTSETSKLQFAKTTGETTIGAQKLAERIDRYVEEDILPSLADFVRIPNLSSGFDLEHKTNGLHQKACQFVMDWAHTQDIKGLTLELHDHPDRTPLIYGEVAASPGIDSTIFMYGHIDKQPHLTDQWREGLHPTEPVREGNKMYGRGVADDGYAFYSSLSIVKILQEMGLPHSRFILFFETDEESGSKYVMQYIEDLKHRIGKPNLIICLGNFFYL